jgi:radical SAM protein with 4Fe4S-binding SPASM domain
MHDLTAPVRLTWDLPPDPGLTAEFWREIVGGRVLFVEIRVSLPSLRGLPGLVTGEVASGGPRLSFIGEPEPLQTTLEVLGSDAVSGAEFLVLPPYGSASELAKLATTTSHLVPSLWSTPEGMSSFPAAVETAREFSLSAVAVLNPPAPAAPLTPRIRDEAARTWLDRGLPGAELRVHDVFLAEKLGLNPFRQYAGCQAGSTLAHLTARGEVVGCRTLPEKLGDLSEQSLREIWAGEARRALRDRLREAPDGCQLCTLVSTCTGGCRGLAPRLGRDLSCAGARRGGAP